MAKDEKNEAGFIFSEPGQQQGRLRSQSKAEALIKTRSRSFDYLIARS